MQINIDRKDLAKANRARVNLQMAQAELESVYCDFEVKYGFCVQRDKLDLQQGFIEKSDDAKLTNVEAASLASV